MAKETRLELRIGTDFAFLFPVLNEDEDEAINISGWALSFMIKRAASDSDAAALLTLTTAAAITIAGTYNVDPDVNAQRATVAVADTDTDALASGSAQWELKRTDAGFETILGYGEMRLYRTLHRT